MAITSLPTPPSRSDPANFPERADAFMAALPQFADEANVLQTEVNQAAVAVDNDATAAAASSSYAANRAASAAASASSATDAQQAATQKAVDAGASASLAERWATKLGGPVSGDGFSAQHYAQIAALGAGLPVVFAGSIPTSNIGPVYISGQGPAEWYGATNAYRVISEIPVGKVEWCSLRAAIWPGYVPGDGQTISRATYPDITEMVIAGRVPVVSEADWLADPLKRGAYSLGNGSTTIRLPDYNGKSPGSLGVVYPSGDGLHSPGTNGLIQRDALQNITGDFDLSAITGPLGASASSSGAFKRGALIRANVPSPTASTGYSLGFDASLSARTADVTRPQSVTGCFVIKAFGVVVNPGSVDAAQLATDYAVLNAAVQTAQGQISKAFGVGQQWYTYTAAERGGSNVYVNSTPQLILVKYTGTSTAAGNLAMVLDGENYLRIFWDGTNIGAGVGATMLVPPGGNYAVGGASFNRGTWSEYRGYR